MSIYTVTHSIREIEKAPNSIQSVYVLPKIDITSPEQFVPIHLALDYYPDSLTMEKYAPYLEGMVNKSAERQEEITKTFVTKWLKEVSKKILTSYNETIVLGSTGQNSEVVLGRRLVRCNQSSGCFTRLGLFTSIKHSYNTTLGTKQFESVETVHYTFGEVYYLELVKAKVLPLVATALLLKQPLKLDLGDIKILTLNRAVGLQTMSIVKETFPEKRKQGIIIEEVENQVMLDYLVGKPEEKTNEQLLEGARKILEEETMYV